MSKSEGILLSSGTNEVEFIEFYINGISYGINVSKVQKVIELSSTKITKLIQAPSSVLGTFHLQDKPVAVIDLKSALNIPELEDSETFDKDQARRLILVAKFNQQTTGYVIDAIHKIHRTSWKEFQPLGDEMAGANGTGGYTTGTIEIDGRVVLILDLERLMLDFCSEEINPQDNVDVPDSEMKTSREQLNIVYAEDSRIIRKITEETLLKAGYSGLKSFENGQKAYDYLSKMEEQAKSEGKALNQLVDLIITDIEMPQMDGLTLCRHVKDSSNEKSKIPSVVVYSSLINREMEHKCQSVGADAQLSKPHGDQIIGVIDELCLGKN